MAKFFRPHHAALLAAGLVLAGQASAAELKLQPEGKELTRTVETLLTEVAPKGSGLELRLSTAGGPRVVWGNESGVPFNPDLVARTSGRGSSRLIELNPAGPLNRSDALRQVLLSEFELSEWTPEAARLRFSGADLNADGRVDLTDLALMMEAYGNTGRGDLNGDRRVDKADLDLFGKSYRVMPLAAPAPEPEKPEPAEAKPAQPTPTPPPAQPSEPNTEEVGAEPPEGAAAKEPQPEDNPEPPQAEPAEPAPDTPPPDEPTEGDMPAPPTP